MIRSTSVSRWQRCSVVLTMNTGQHPMPESSTVAVPAVMSMVVSGRAMRFVRRKYFGKEWNLYHARGPVKSWQEMLRAALCQIFLSGEEDSGYHFSMWG